MEFSTNQTPPAGCSWIYVVKFYTKTTDQLFSIYIGATETPISGRTGIHFSNAFLGSSDKKNYPSHKLMRMCGETRIEVEPWGIVPTYMAHFIETCLIQTYKNICINVAQKKKPLELTSIVNPLIYCVNPDDYDVEAVYTSAQEIMDYKGFDLLDINEAIESNGTKSLGNKLWIMSTKYVPPENNENLFFAAKANKKDANFHTKLLNEINRTLVPVAYSSEQTEKEEANEKAC